MQNKTNIFKIILIMVATFSATILFQNIFSFDYKNEINVTDILSLLVNGLLAYYIGTHFVRSNDKNKTIREFYLKEVLTFIENTKTNLEEIKGIQNDFIFTDTSIYIQNLRDRVEYLILLNHSLLQDKTEINDKLNDLSQSLRQIDLVVNSGIGATSNATLLIMQNEYNNSIYQINNDFAFLLKMIF